MRLFAIGGGGARPDTGTFRVDACVSRRGAPIPASTIGSGTTTIDDCAEQR